MHRRTALTLAVALGGLVGAWMFWRGSDPLPAPGSPAYEATARGFYRGLAGLQVGLLDSARVEFTHVTELVPTEPAGWANLGIIELRLGDLEAAVPPIERAASLAPNRSEVAALVARMEIARGRIDEGVASFRRAVALDPGNRRARFALAEEVERAGGPAADDEAQQTIEALLAIEPDNVAVLVERLRLAAKRRDAALLRNSIERLDMRVTSWPAPVEEQLGLLRSAVTASDFTGSVRAAAFFKNLVAATRVFQDGLAAVSTPLAESAQPFDRFIALSQPVSTPSAPDTGLAYDASPLTPERGPSLSALVMAPTGGEPAAMILGTDGREMFELDLAQSASVTRGRLTGTAGLNGLLAIDWNNDFRADLLATGREGVRLLTQDDRRAFTDVTSGAAGEGTAAYDAFGAWAADLEMDGDLDVVIGLSGAEPVALRNNGDGTWLEVHPFAGVSGIRAMAWADVDRDGDPDATLLDAGGNVHVFANAQAGAFRRLQGLPRREHVLAVATGDANADGVLDIITLDAAGALRRASMAGAGWDDAQLASWSDLPGSREPGAYRLLLPDLDNNGGSDLLASGAGGSAIWLSGERGGVYQPLAGAPEADVVGALDVNDDGRLDLVGLANGRPVRFLSRGQMRYHWHVVRPRAQKVLGDQRVNSFGVGGEIEVRAGLLTQKQVLTGLPVHVGLGTRTAIDITRIVWPNGVMQAEFDSTPDRPIVAEQRLKGSCPWVFTYDGTGMRFITDFLWRSPLGLRINAQDTAGISQTEDWVKISGEALAPREGVYDIRITAELWETHFIDHVALLAVDHPAGTEVFVDERFARAAPALTVHVARPPVPIVRARDDNGRDVTALVAAQDGRYLDTFERGAYQGIAREHYVEFELDEAVTRSRPRMLVARGWIYPTDSSINVAIAQGRAVRPRGLSLEAEDPSGRWVVVEPDLGFPAGKNKTVLIDLNAATRAGLQARRFRLRTNLEVYWDSLHTTEVLARTVARTARLLPARSELRFRGFSETDFANRAAPEIPRYDRLAGTAQRWRDLVGYYTRFGDVRELTSAVDDRYVIMNAGDELRLAFDAPEAPAAGWRRDFVLIGDGWEKDGDFNTGFSQTVHPLPTHDSPDYDGSLELADDPVYRRHREDWERYHTRFVTPRAFLNGLRTK